jgi:hypothetical protein
VSQTYVPWANVAEQTVPQLIPAGLLVTVPEPDPLVLTVNLYVAVDLKLAAPAAPNPANTATAATITTLDRTRHPIGISLLAACF